jgi:RNA polymerase sigma-70 factor (ECF subfamily)
MSPTELVRDGASADGSPRTGQVSAAMANAITDRQLISAVSAGNVEAFAELYDRYCDRAYRVAVSVCRDDGRAQDAAQEAFLAVWRSAASYRPQQGTVAAWLLTVVRHRAIDVARRNDKHDAHRASDDELDQRAAPDDVCDAAVKRDDADRLQARLALLPDGQQEVITLAFYGQLSHTEIATRLALPAGTIKGRMRLGLHKLRTNLDQAVA